MWWETTMKSADNLIALDPLPISGFGRLDQDTQAPMREIQFALKVVW
jgi:hypothetical protein